METVTAPTSGDLTKYSSPLVIKKEPLIECLDNGAVNLHPCHYHITDSVMQGVKEESTTQGSQQSIDVSIKQEPLEAEWKYPTPWPPVDVDDEQITTIHGSMSLTDDGIKLEKADRTEMSTTMTTPKVEDARCKAGNVHTLSHSRCIPKPPLPVALYRHLTEEVNMAKIDNAAVGYCETPLLTKNDGLGIHTDRTHTCTDGEPYCEYRHIGDTSPHTDIEEPTCDETFQSEKPLGCSQCDYIPANKGRLAVHMRRHAKEKSFVCSSCDFRSVSSSHLLIHMRKHTGEKPFECSLCDYKSAYKWTLDAHMRRHTGEKPFKCTVCDYRGATKGYLDVHMLIHTRERPFDCSLCNYRAGTKSKLNRHIRIHTGEKPFKCTVCDYRGATNGNLVGHMMTHTGEKPFKCSLCNYRAVTKSTLKRHMRTH